MLRKIKILSLFLVFSCLYINAQVPDKITVKQQNQIFFFRVGDFKDSLVIKSVSDLFYLKISDDKKGNTEIKVKNGSLLKTTTENLYKLIYLPGVQYRLIHELNDSIHQIDPNKLVYKIDMSTQPDGTTQELANRQIKIDLINNKTGKVLLTNSYFYKEK